VLSRTIAWLGNLHMSTIPCLVAPIGGAGPCICVDSGRSPVQCSSEDIELIGRSAHFSNHSHETPHMQISNNGDWSLGDSLQYPSSGRAEHHGRGGTGLAASCSAGHGRISQPRIPMSSIPRRAPGNRRLAHHGPPPPRKRPPMTNDSDERFTLQSTCGPLAGGAGERSKFAVGTGSDNMPRDQYPCLESVYVGIRWNDERSG
jgi:hypothetical protein